MPPGIDPRLLFYECDAWTNSTGQSTASAGLSFVTSAACVACLEAFYATLVRSWATSPSGDDCYVDPLISSYAVDQIVAFGEARRRSMQRAALSAASPSPFAFFVGFKRPHLGFQVPERFLELYPADVPLAAHRMPADGPASSNGEIRSFHDVPPFVEPNATFPGRLRDAKHGEL